ncbi:MAG: heat-inducible transcription repressor HrcA [Deltaproteobacteria bacterium]|nr:heat-inducible transcription repressor HrcA [Deltaproteobacteria bacterium]
MTGEITLNDREQFILTAVIEDYIATAEPVGSRTLTKRPDVAVSAATIRNIMADLEEMGLLTQPHTSAGRVPTERAFRFYVDTLVTLRRPTVRERDQLEHPVKTAGDVQQATELATRHLSSLSHLTGVMLAPRPSGLRLHHVEFIRLPDERILVIVVDTSGQVHNKILVPEQGRPLDQRQLEELAGPLNEHCRGLTLDEARVRILDEMRQTGAAMSQLVAQVLDLAGRAASPAGRSAGDVFLAGETRVLDSPEFAGADRMRSLLRAFEERQGIISLLDRIQAAEEVRVFIGEETRYREMAQCAVVAAPYGGAGTPLGCIGVIGPMRMDYARVVPLVELTAQALTRFLSPDRR